jgi:hypothetical protein
MSSCLCAPWLVHPHCAVMPAGNAVHVYYVLLLLLLLLFAPAGLCQPSVAG